MLSIGFFEIVIIALVALVVLGPERLPFVMRQIAKIYRHITNFKSELAFHINSIDYEEKQKKISPKEISETSSKDIT